jgi:N-glycosylase/DNA lyase
VLGFGYKEASHFLRNIGYTGLAILDRHVLRGMVRLGVLAEIPKIGSRRAYLGVEKIFIDASRVIGIEPEALDLLLWYEATGEVFK